MKLVIVCKDDTKKASNNNLTVVCEACKGIDVKTSIKMIMEDYGDEIKEIICPNCDVIKKIIGDCI